MTDIEQDEAPRLNRREQAKIRTAKRVLDAARELFEEDGYAKATIRDIAAKAGMSTGAVFANYKDKVDLYKAVYGHAPLTPEQGRTLLQAQTMGADMNTPNMLIWAAERLVSLGDDPNADFILSLRDRATAGAVAIILAKEPAPCST